MREIFTPPSITLLAHGIEWRFYDHDRSSIHEFFYAMRESRVRFQSNEVYYLPRVCSQTNGTDCSCLLLIFIERVY